jgi:hypothetical protein
MFHCPLGLGQLPGTGEEFVESWARVVPSSIPARKCLFLQPQFLGTPPMLGSQYQLNTNYCCLATSGQHQRLAEGCEQGYKKPAHPFSINYG